MNPVVASAIDYDRLTADLAALRATFDAAVPFRHVVVDDFLAPDVARALTAEFPPLTPAQRKAARILAARMYNVPAEHLREHLQMYFAELSAQRFTGWLRALTGVGDLEMDPQNIGGGVHRGARGSQLYVHADHNTHPDDPTWYRRFNVLLYLTPEWEPKWGGELQLWDATSSQVVTTVAPRFNRCVVMEVHDRAFHGYRPLHYPGGTTRDSLAAYYYSRTPSTMQKHDAHPTVFGVQRDCSPASRAASHLKRALLTRVFRNFLGLPPQAAAQSRVGGDVGESLVEPREDGVAVDLEQ